MLKWEPGAREDDAINRGSVVLASRRTGHLVNEKASKEAKFKPYQTPILKQKTMLLLVEKSSRPMLLTIGNI